MNTNENTNETVRNDATEDVIELGVASVETQGAGGPLPTEQYGEYPGASMAEE